MKHFLTLFALAFGLQFNGFSQAISPTSTSISNQSACNGLSTTCPTDDFFTADLTVFYDEKPASGTLSLSGGDLIGTPPSANVADIGATSHTFSGVNLRSDGSAIELTAAFSAGGSFLGNSLGTAPAACSGVPQEVVLSGRIQGCALANGTYYLNGLVNGAPRWSHPVWPFDVRWDGTKWVLANTSFGGPYEEGFILGGSPGFIPCGTWQGTAGNVFCAGTMNFCGSLSGTFSGISLADAGNCDNKSTCTPTDDTFTANATVHFAFAPVVGDLLLKRGATILAVKAASELGCASEWTFENVEMPANGQPIVLTAEFENGPTFTSPSLGNTPFCSTGEITNFTATNISGCNGNSTTCETDDFFTADLTVTFQNIPATGSLVLSGADILEASPTVSVAGLSGNSYTFTAVHLRTDGQIIDLTASFTDGCFFQNPNLGTAPTACSSFPSTIIVGGFPVCPAETGPYQVSGIFNGAPTWSSATDDLRWNGVVWEIIYRPIGAVLAFSPAGNAGLLPCTGWTNSFGCGIPTFGFCGPFSASAINQISQISLVNPSACQGNTSCLDDFFTASVTVNFGYAPPSGNLVLKRGATILATKPASELTCATNWTFENLQMLADGGPIILTAEFENGVSFTAPSLGNAPAACSDKKIKTISLANLSGCSHLNTTCATDDFFTADVTLTFTSVPPTGTLSLSGNDLQGTPPTVNVANISGNSHTFNGVKLRADGLAVALTASFSDGCSLTKNNLATASAGCSSPPPVIVVSGYCAAALNGNYNLAGMENGAPIWINPIFGYAQRVIWNGTDWVVMSNHVPLSVNYGGNAGFFPCNGWTNLNSCGTPSFNFCGEIGPNLSENNLLGISLTDPTGCQNKSTCEPSDDVFTAGANVQFIFAPSAGNLILKRGTTVLATKPASELACATNWTFENVEMTADGQPIVLTAEFEMTATSFTSPSFGDAPAACSFGKISGLAVINFSTCNGQNTTCTSDDTWASDFQVQFNQKPASGTLSLNVYNSAGTLLFAPVSVNVAQVAGVSHTFSGVLLRAVAGDFSISAEFSQGCSLSAENIGTVPVCENGQTSLSKITLGALWDCNGNGTPAPTDDHFTSDVIVNFANAPGSGDLILKKGSTVLATKPASELACATVWVFEAVQMSADGQPIVLTAQFSGTTFTSGSLATAPATCNCSLANTFQIVRPTCNGGSNGTIFTTTSGGTTPYIYVWNNSKTTKNINLLAAGNYAVTTTDRVGCETANTVNVGQPSAMMMNVMAQPNSASIETSGGAPAYSYTRTGILNFQTSPVFSGLAPGATYIFKTRDANGCQKSVIKKLPTSMAPGGGATRLTTQSRLTSRAGNEIPTENDPQFAVFPNPVSEILNVEFLSNEKIAGQIAVVDLLGRVVFSKNMEIENESVFQISVKDFTAGGHVLVFRNDNGKVEVARFVVEKN